MNGAMTCYPSACRPYISSGMTYSLQVLDISVQTAVLQLLLYACSAWIGTDYVWCAVCNGAMLGSHFPRQVWCLANIPATKSILPCIRHSQVLLHNWKASIKNFKPETGYPEWGLTWSPQPLQVNNSKWFHNCLLPHSLQFIIHTFNHSTLSTDCASK
jgi:hypothetical protein